MVNNFIDANEFLFFPRECGCGEGDSGCSQCGACRICARENVDNSEMAILGPSGASDIAGMMRLDLIFGGMLLLI